MRWRNAQQKLVPIVEMIPHLMVIPVLLFVIGLLDSLISANQRLIHPSIPMLTANAISILFVGITLVSLGSFLLDSLINSSSSPFSSAFSRLLSRSGTTEPVQLSTFVLPNRAEKGAIALTDDEIATYHEIVQQTRDDGLLDQAASALENVIRQKLTITEPCVQTLAYLLSPEASFRSNLTAASTLVRLYDAKPYGTSSTILW